MNYQLRFTFSAILALTALAPAFCTTLPLDSVGIERKNGRQYILHRVDQGQTLYGVSRRYGATLDAIKAANPDLAENTTVRYDQLIRVPMADAIPGEPSRKERREAERTARKEEKEREKADRNTTLTAATTERSVARKEPEVTAARPPKTQPGNVPGSGLHVVETGQTLYSLAVRYNVTMADLRRWNNLGADGIQVGQSLIVSEKAANEPRPADRSAPAAAKTKPTSARPMAEPVRVETKPIITPDPLPMPGTRPKTRPAAEPKPVETRSAETKPADKQTETRTERTATNSRGRKVQAEVGFADIIDGNDNSSKYMALHRSAPIGTLVQVRNDITNQSLYVKVIGKLPDTGLNTQVLIRLSERAFEKLSPNGQRFRAEVSYSN